MLVYRGCCKMFRKLTTTVVAIGQLAGSLKPRAAPRIFLDYFLFCLSCFRCFCSYFGMLFGFFCVSYLNPPSSHHQTDNHITNMHGCTCTEIQQNTKNQQNVRASVLVFLPYLALFKVHTHTHTPSVFYCSLYKL